MATQPDAASSQAVAVVTDRSFFGYLLEHGPSSRADIASGVGLSRPTASEAANRLSEAGLIIPAPRPQAAGRRGRAPDYYDVNPEYGHTLALAAASGLARVRTTNLQGAVVRDLQLELGEIPMSQSELVQALRELTQQAIAETGTTCLAAAASQGNPVNPRTLRPVVLPGAPFPEGHGDLLGLLSATTAGPVFLDNDVNCAALAEQRMGAGQGLEDMLLAYLGPGIGAGIVMSGQVQHGYGGAAGELGHLRQGQGTLLDALLDLGVGAAGGRRLSATACRDLFSEGPDDPRAQKFVQLLGSALSNVALVLDPEALLLAGPLIEIPALAEALEIELRKYAGRDSLLVRRAELGEDAPLVGAGIAARNMALEAIWAAYRA